MPEQELSLLIKLKEDASSQLKNLNKEIEGHAKAWKENFGAIQKTLNDTAKHMAIMGGAITGVFALAIKAGAEEQESIGRLRIAIRNLGIDYNYVSRDIETLIATQQRKTNYSDVQQREALSQLILTTGDYKTALDLLPTTLDFAAAKQMDVSNAAVLLGRVATGTAVDLTRYGVVLSKTASTSEQLAAIQLKVKGAAEATANPLTIMKNQLSDVAETIGTAVLPMLTDFINKIIPIIENIINWIKQNPALLSAIFKFGAALLIAAAALKAVAIALTIVQALSGPAGWATLAIGIGVATAAYIALDRLMASGAPSYKTHVRVGEEWVPREEYGRYVSPLQAGGIVTRPMLSMVGEAGPEAVVPLNRISSFGGNVTNNVNLTVHGSVISQTDLQQYLRQSLIQLQLRNVTTGIK